MTILSTSSVCPCCEVNDSKGVSGCSCLGGNSSHKCDNVLKDLTLARLTGFLSEYFNEIQLCSIVYAYADNSFVSTWNISIEHPSLTLPLAVDGVYSFRCDWGDNTSAYITASDQPEATHTYSTPGNFIVRISGLVDGWTFKHTAYSLRKQIIDISHWGCVGLSNNDSTFCGCSALNVSALDTPDLSGMTDMSSMFCGASVFNGDVSKWNTSNVTDMSYMFHGAAEFNGDVRCWNTSNVTNMHSMFDGASAFNGDVSRWNTSKCTDMNSMFYYAVSFNGNVSQWNVQTMTDKRSMFDNASAFNGDVSRWSDMTEKLSIFDKHHIDNSTSSFSDSFNNNTTNVNDNDLYSSSKLILNLKAILLSASSCVILGISVKFILDSLPF